MLTLMFSNAMALTCAIDDVPCNTANALRDLVNEQRPNSIGDARSGKRGTSFIRNKLNELLPTADASGCTPTGISAVEVTSGSFTGEWVDIDFGTGVPSAGGFYLGDFIGNHEFSGVWDGGTVGSWGRFDLPSGKLGALRGSPEDMLIGGIARINGRRSVAWAVHGTCPAGTDVAAAFSPYFPQLERYVAAPEPDTALCSFDVSEPQPGPASAGDCPCVAAVCDADSFCCETTYDGICADSASTFAECETEL